MGDAIIKSSLFLRERVIDKYPGDKNKLRLLTM